MWRKALRGELPYALTVRVVEERGEVIAGICAERYPRSGCGLITYLVVAEQARKRGLGRELLDDAVARLGAPLVLGEVSGAERLARFERWGARRLDVRYVQPALAPGLARDRSLALIAFPPVAARVDGAIVRAFVEELYAVTEGGDPDAQVVIRSFV